LSATQKLFRFGVFELNLDTEELLKSGTAVKLPPQPLRLLILLTSRAGQVVTREEIQQEFWGKELDIDVERRMNQCIQQIRTALGDNANRPLYLETIHRHGYRFIAPVESASVPTPALRITESPSSGTERDIASRVLARIAAIKATAPDAAPAPATIPAAGKIGYGSSSAC
jgi:DNA-binding winged helix-turn-helix (wHTH) protein